jgi:hypothetical protein
MPTFAPSNNKNVMIMKKVLLISVGALLLLSSCGTYTADGAVTGGWFGSVIGSAIGGIAGGHRGSDVGTLIGMAGGAMIGAAVGQAADEAQQRKYEDYQMARQRTNNNRQRDYSYQDNSGYNGSNSGDDRLYGFDENFGSTGASAPVASSTGGLEIRNARLLDSSRDGMLVRGEEARMVFEIFNTSDRVIRCVQPAVAEVTGNKHIHISENILIESIAPGKGVRYTAAIKADNGLRDGEAVIRIGVLQANREVTSQTREFTVQTRKR